MSAGRRVPREWAGALALALGALALVAAPVAAQVTLRSTVSSTRLSLGEPADWLVVLSGGDGPDAPAIPALAWAAVQEAGSERNFSWVNGRGSARTIYRFRLVPTVAGRQVIPAVRLTVKGRTYVTDPIPVEVLAGPPAGGELPDVAPGDPRLRLVASLAPREVVVGQPVILGMRLDQGVRLLADPGYTPPPTPRFYAEKSGPVSSRYVEDAGGRWLVGETQTVLYPTVPGRLTVGPARAVCVLADRDLPGGIEVEITSRPVSLDVRPLPPAPAGFAGAVADVALTGTLDRATVRADEALQVTLRLAGRGNLRLAPAPALPAAADFQVFDRTVEDSIDVDHGLPSGSKIVRYALLPRRTGPLVVPGIEYVTYVPGEGYRTLRWPGARVEVTPGLARDDTNPAATRAALLVPTDRPGGSPWTAARPFAGAALVAFALALWLARLRLRPRRTTAAAEDDAESAAPDPQALARGARDAAAALAAQQAGLAQARTRGDAAAFWRIAEAALADAAALLPGGAEDAALGARIAAARYAPGGGAAAMDALAPALGTRLAAAQAAATARGRTRAPRAARIGAGVLIAAGVALLGLGAWAVAAHPDDSTLGRTLAAARDELRGNDVRAAKTRLYAAWNAGARRPGVAVDLALAAWYERRLGEAALWTERARRLDPRHPLVDVLRAALVEEGAWEGLPVGARARTTGGEIAFAACLLLALALVGFVLGRRQPVARWSARALAVAALGLGIYAAQSGAAGEAPGRAVVLRAVPLSPAPGAAGDVELEAGRAVWLEGEAAPGWARVRVGSQVRGTVPTSAVRAL